MWYTSNSNTGERWYPAVLRTVSRIRIAVDKKSKPSLFVSGSSHYIQQYVQTFSVTLHRSTESGSGWYLTRSTSALFTSRPRRLSPPDKLSPLDRLSPLELLPVSEAQPAGARASEAGDGAVEVLAESVVAVGSLLLLWEDGLPSSEPPSLRAVRKATLGRLSTVAMCPVSGVPRPHTQGKRHRRHRKHRNNSRQEVHTTAVDCKRILETRWNYST